MTAIQRPSCHPGIRCQQDGGVLSCRNSPALRTLTRRQALLGLLAAPAVAAGTQPAAATVTSFDLPACNTFSTSKSGIKWCDSKAGTGSPPEAGDQIQLNYVGRSLDTGKIFDGSNKRFSWTLDQDEQIEGWEKAILGTEDIPPIREGGRRTVQIPASLAYGQRGLGCLFGRDNTCRVPPNTAVEITFQYLGLF